MITVLSGDNGFALEAKLHELVAAFISAHGDIAVERLDGASMSVERIRESLQSAPFLATRKLVMLRQPSLNKQFVEAAEKVLSDTAETTDVIVVEPKVDKRSSYYKWLKKSTDFQEFPELDELGLVRWLVATAKEQGGELSQNEARRLVQRIGLDQQLLANELNKLLIYNPHITQSTIELLTEATPQSKVFDLLDAAFSGNAQRAIELYQDQRSQRVDPSQIIAMIAWQLRILAIVKAANGRKSAEIVRDARISPYTVDKSEAIASRISLTRLKQLINDLLQIDVRSKRERIDLDEALQNYLLSLATR